MGKVKRIRRTKAEMEALKSGSTAKVETSDLSEYKKVEHRGRPKEVPFVEPPKKFERVFTEKSGIVQIWKYDLNKFPNGPIDVEFKYPKGYVDEVMENDENLPITKRQWINPANGKLVGYGRAKQLGLLSEQESPTTGKRGRPAKK